MANGKIKADTLEHSTAGSVDTQYVVNGSAKSWINFNGTGTVAIRDSLNISSITDNGTGDYSITINNAYASNTWSCVSNAERVSGTAEATTSQYAVTTTVERLNAVRADTGANVDSGTIGMSGMGDLA